MNSYFFFLILTKRIKIKVILEETERTIIEQMIKINILINIFIKISR